MLIKRKRKSHRHRLNFIKREKETGKRIKQLPMRYALKIFHVLKLLYVS